MIPIEERILGLLDEPRTRHFISKALGLDGLTVKEKLDQMVRAGTIVKTGGGAGTKYDRAGIMSPAEAGLKYERATP